MKPAPKNCPICNAMIRLPMGKALGGGVRTSLALRRAVYGRSRWEWLVDHLNNSHCSKSASGMAVLGIPHDRDVNWMTARQKVAVFLESQEDLTNYLLAANMLANAAGLRSS